MSRSDDPKSGRGAGGQAHSPARPRPAAILVEVGWTGYATDRLLTARSALATALVLGVVWALWHVIAMLEMPAGHSWALVVLQGANQVIVRILIVWIYVASGGSLFAAIGLHALLNVATMTLFPVYGSHNDPLVANVVLGVAAVVIVRLWGSSTLASLRLTGRPGTPGNAPHAQSAPIDGAHLDGLAHAFERHRSRFGQGEPGRPGRPKD